MTVDSSVPSDSPVRVNLATGVLRGSVRGGIARFLGVPYAAAPVGENRFARPAPVSPWTGERDATIPGATSPQAPYLGALHELLPNPIIEGPDFLTVSIWAPHAPAAPAPVLVWIHGGSLTRGSNAVPLYDGTAFARDGIVVVSVNYRLGAEGFSVLDGAPLNLGIHDQVAALRWVAENIAHFGGDPERVTVCGESAGGASAAALMVSPETRGLIHRVIVQSGPLHTDSAHKGARFARAIARTLRIPATKEAFAELSLAELLAVQNRVEASSSPLTGGAAFQISTDPELIPVSPDASLAAGVAADIPLLLSTCRDEYRLWFVPDGLVNRIRRWHITAARLRFGVSARTIRVFRRARPESRPGETLGEVTTDLMLRVPAYAAADARLSHGASTHVCEFAWPTPVYDIRAGHALEIPFVFDRLDDPAALPYTGARPSQDVATAMHGAWVAFIRGETPGWPEWDASRPVGVVGAPGRPVIETVHGPREPERASLARDLA